MPRVDIRKMRPDKRANPRDHKFGCPSDNRRIGRPRERAAISQDAWLPWYMQPSPVSKPSQLDEYDDDSPCQDQVEEIAECASTRQSQKDDSDEASKGSPNRPAALPVSSVGVPIRADQGLPEKSDSEVGDTCLSPPVVRGSPLPSSGFCTPPRACTPPRSCHHPPLSPGDGVFGESPPTAGCPMLGTPLWKNSGRRYNRRRPEPLERERSPQPAAPESRPQAPRSRFW